MTTVPDPMKFGTCPNTVAAGNDPHIAEALSLSTLRAALITVLNGLPALPAEPENYPDAGGLFKDGDANGYRLVRILPKF